MTQVDLYLYSQCSSCRNAVSVLAERGASVAKRDLFKERLSPAEIVALFDRIGKTPHEMLSSRSRPYQQLGLAQRTLTDGAIVELMAEHPALIRRPIVVAGGQGHVGFNRAAIERLVDTANHGGNGDA
jgi:Spx/MgsR family transcriptional regulator